MKPSNPYHATRSADDPRQQEATALRLAARKLREAGDRSSRGRALRLNHELWSLLLRDLAGENNRLPPVLKRDCTALAVFSLDYSTRAVLTDLALEPLAALNERVAEGLEAAPSSRTGASAGVGAPSGGPVPARPAQARPVPARPVPILISA